MVERELEKPIRWAWDAFLLSLALLGIAVLPFLFVFTAYIEGLGFDDFWWAPTCAVFLVAPGAFVGLFLRTCWLWRRMRRGGRVARVLSVLALILALVVCVVCARTTADHTGQSEAMAYLYGARRRLRPSVDFAAIRAWAKANPGWRDEIVDHRPREARRPTFIRDLQPLYVSVSEDGARTWLELPYGSILIGIHDQLVLLVQPEDSPPPEPGVRAVCVVPGVVIGLVNRRAVFEHCDWVRGVPASAPRLCLPAWPAIMPP